MACHDADSCSNIWTSAKSVHAHLSQQSRVFVCFLDLLQLLLDYNIVLETDHGSLACCRKT